MNLSRFFKVLKDNLEGFLFLLIFRDDGVGEKLFVNHEKFHGVNNICHMNRLSLIFCLIPLLNSKLMWHVMTLLDLFDTS